MTTGFGPKNFKKSIRHECSGMQTSTYPFLSTLVIYYIDTHPVNSLVTNICVTRTPIPLRTNVINI